MRVFLQPFIACKRYILHQIFLPHRLSDLSFIVRAGNFLDESEALRISHERSSLIYWEILDSMPAMASSLFRSITQINLTWQYSPLWTILNLSLNKQNLKMATTNCYVRGTCLTIDPGLIQILLLTVTEATKSKWPLSPHCRTQKIPINNNIEAPVIPRYT